MSIQQLFQSFPWPSGDNEGVAMLGLTPEELERLTGIRFSPGRDDLDGFVEAALLLPSGRYVLLMRYDHQPIEGTTVFVDAGDWPEPARRELLDALGLDQESFTWVSERAEPRISRATGPLRRMHPR